MTGTIDMTDTVIGTGAYRYRFQRDWAKLPRWWNFGEAHLPGPPRTTVKGAVAANGDIYVLCRAAHPVLVFDADGRFVTSWGEGQFSSFVHGLTIDAAGKVWITDTSLHTVTQHEPDGTLLRTFGMRGMAMPTLYGKTLQHADRRGVQLDRRDVRLRRLRQSSRALLLDRGAS